MPHPAESMPAASPAIIVAVLSMVVTSQASGCGSRSVEPAPEPAATDEAPPAEPALAKEEARLEEARLEEARYDEPRTVTAPARTSRTGRPDVHFVPTPMPVVRKMLEVARVTADDLVYDLGCGDGRIVIMAAGEFGARAVGFDIDPELVAEARVNVEEAGVGHLVTIEEADIFDLDLSPASVVTLYLLPGLNVRLIPQLEMMKEGSRIVSHDFDMAGIAYEQLHVVRAADPDGDADLWRDHQVYFWSIPLKREGWPRR